MSNEVAIYIYKLSLKLLDRFFQDFCVYVYLILYQREIGVGRLGLLSREMKRLSIYQSMYHAINKFIVLSIYLSIYSSSYQSIHFSIYLSVDLLIQKGLYYFKENEKVIYWLIYYHSINSLLYFSVNLWFDVLIGLSICQLFIC